jgi:hypothetical protein
VSVEEVVEVGGKIGRGQEGKKKKGGENRRREYKEREENSWGRERKVKQERAKQIDISTEWKREIGKIDCTKRSKE